MLVWPKGSILKSAIKKGPILLICIKVPDDCRVFSVDISSINQVLFERIRLKINKLNYPSPSVFEAPQCELSGKVVALIVDRSVLVDLEKNWSGISQKYFREAYIAEKVHRALSFNLLKLASPQRRYDLNTPRDVLWNVDAERARYAVYRLDANIDFIDGAGYTDPLNVPVKIDALYIRGLDFIRWFKEMGYFFYIGSGCRWPMRSISVLEGSPAEECFLGDGGLSELSSGLDKPRGTQKPRMNDFRIQVVRGVFRIMKERSVSASEVHADALLRLFNDGAIKGTEGFYFKKVGYVGNKRDLHFLSSTECDYKITKKKTAACLKVVVKQIEDGVLGPDEY